ncbi:MAG: SUMF1/EgtB/PvdO family nonheme iron enzyme [Candidatus Riflebacteria bacterium]|nr:SUMF1/EgtB/PvdO family nonheme iron enzyme [Candidatus Riflebacteria bacterium]
MLSGQARILDLAGTTTRGLSLTVVAPVAPTIVTTSLPDAHDQVSYASSLVATGTPPFTWALTAGALPSGITLTAAGAVTGTPVATGTASFTVRAANVAGSATRQLSVAVTPPVTPVISTTTTLGNAFAGHPYSLSLEATGTPPRWSVAAGALPTGLALNTWGSIAGTPVATGSVSVTLRATNPAGTSERAFAMHVLGPPTYLATNAKGYREYLNEKDGSVLIEIPAQGVTPAYFIGKYEVTNAQYRPFLAATSDPYGPTQHVGHDPAEGAGYSHTPTGGGGVHRSPYSVGANNPVVGVSWYDAYAYCAWAGLELPRETRWQYAAQGPDDRMVVGPYCPLLYSIFGTRSPVAYSNLLMTHPLFPDIQAAAELAGVHVLDRLHVRVVVQDLSEGQGLREPLTWSYPLLTNGILDRYDVAFQNDRFRVLVRSAPYPLPDE